MPSTEERLTSLEKVIDRAAMLDWLARSLDKYLALRLIEDFAPKTEWFRELKEQVDALRDLHAASLDHRHE